MGASGNRQWRNGAIIGGVVFVLVGLAIAAWWWMQSRNQTATNDQRARLQVLLDRQRALTDELAKIRPVEPPKCPPGQTLRPIDRTAPTGSDAPDSRRAPLPTNGDAAVLTSTDLARRLEQATAIVLVAGEDSLETGTGFFIAPNLLVTNRHVVENSTGRRIFLAGKALGSVRRASVLHVTPNSDPGSPDFALLQLEIGTAPGTLDVSSEINKLAGVVAAGYPGVVLQNDTNFQRLLRGEMSAAPDLNLTQGAVQSLQTGAGGMPLIVHTASIAKGNSGGPLVDSCGRVVGVNTFINVDQSQSAKINYAIRSQAMATFLEAAGAGARADLRPCPAK